MLSGGVGSRLWPLSRKSKPKQYIPLFENTSLFQMGIERNKNLSDQMMVVGSIDNYLLSRAEFEKSGVNNYVEIIEAAPRNTAASIAFAALVASPEDVLLVTPSDHIFKGKNAYGAVVAIAQKLALQGYIVTFGAQPTRPETGYGYIEHDADFNVLSFKEKPSAAVAESFVQAGNFLWNSGMFCFTAATYLEELAKYAPEVLQSAKQALAQSVDGFLPLDLTMEIPSISVDYAVMEHSQKIKVVPFSFEWNDLGSFEAIWDYLEKQDGHSDVKNLVLGSNKHVEFIGVEDLILVETADAILVVPRNQSQQVKTVYERLEKEKAALVL
ncbi:MAG TPA: sugar phosphate nucleotidyltransferase [Niabella sp.]|nr:sugar phosphate nucleotidyltransferase [Niabella sp.]HUN04934.1 sugar phosphate nucleotidyltransferase [Niabella sp.]